MGTTREDVVFIYVLIDPRDTEVRYIGQTLSPSSRIRNHKKISSKHDGLGIWIKELKAAGFSPEMKIVATATRETCYQEERGFILKYLLSGQRLFNSNLPSGKKQKVVHCSQFNCKVLWKQTGKVFNSCEEAGRYFKKSGGTILNWTKACGLTNGMKTISVGSNECNECICSDWEMGDNERGFRFCPWCGVGIKKGVGE